MITLKQLAIGRNNNFDLLRFIAATCVILSHSYLVTGKFNNDPLIRLTGGMLDLGAFGVTVFFSISGFLITKSMLKQPDLNRFIIARCLRIFPGLVIAAVFCGFIIGPMSTSLSLDTYFKSSTLYDFIWRHITLFKFVNQLPGTFQHNLYPYAVNSPIWTLPAELLLYGFILLAGVVLLVYKKLYKPLRAAVPALILVVLYFWGVGGYTSRYMFYVGSWACLFGLGVGSYLFRDKLILSITLFILLLAVFVVTMYFKVPHKIYLFNIILVYGLLLFAYHPLLQVKSFHKLGDPSYGLYIFAFPIQQLLYLNFTRISPVVHFLASYAIVLPLALLSWHFIEKPILKLKTTQG